MREMRSLSCSVRSLRSRRGESKKSKKMNDMQRNGESVTGKFGREPLPRHRIVEGLVAASELVPLDVDEHLREARGESHAEGAEGTDDG